MKINALQSKWLKTVITKTRTGFVFSNGLGPYFSSPKALTLTKKSGPGPCFR